MVLRNIQYIFNQVTPPITIWNSQFVTVNNFYISEFTFIKDVSYPNEFSVTKILTLCRDSSGYYLLCKRHRVMKGVVGSQFPLNWSQDQGFPPY